jgi:hypothetical protein
MIKHSATLFQVIALSAGALGFASGAYASLIDQGATVYDTDLSVAWLKDANLAATQTFGVAGINAVGNMSWDTAHTWVAAMNAANYLGYNDWRLPLIVDTGTPGCNYSYNATDCGYNVDTATSEMAHLFYDELHNISPFFTNGSPNPAWVLLGANTSPFVNMIQLTDGYWSSTESAVDPSRAWRVNFGDGYQTTFRKDDPDIHVIVLRDVAAIPEPSALSLLGFGLQGAGALRRRKSTNHS